MKTIYYGLAGFFFFLFSFTTAQTPNTPQQLADSYLNYFDLNRERVYLHLNKNDLVPNEDLWFSAYVFDTQLYLPSLKTTNLLVEVFDTDGKLIESQILFINGGKGAGNLQLTPKKYQEGNYFIKASTSYMNNFQEDLSYVANFRILEGNDSKKKQPYELHILPEGGHLLMNQQNTVGVKLISDSGNGLRFYMAKVVDEAGNLITTFKSNRFGMGKFTFIPIPGKFYTVLLRDQMGRELRKELSPADSRGVNLHANFLGEDLLLSVNTNNESLPEIENKKYILAVHQEGKIKQFEFEFPQDKKTAPLNIPGDSLYPGVNILTIFNEELNPILERQVFNSSINRLRVKASLLKNNSDSLQINLKSEERDLPLNSLSISVLPADTRSVYYSHNILSAFYLKPFLKGEIQDAHYYFSSEVSERRRAYDLDLLLLTQGWSKYSWNDIFNHPPKELYPREKGFSIHGQLNEKKDLSGENLVVLSEDSQLFQIIDVRENNHFEAKNIFLMDSSTVSIGLMKGERNRIIKPKIHAWVEPNRQEPSFNEEFIKFGASPEPIMDFHYLEDFVTKGETLDTVNLKGSSKTKEQIREMLDPSGRTDYIDELTKRRYLFLTQYLRSKGFKILRNIAGNELYIINRRFGQSFSFNSFTQMERVPRQPVILLNGTRLKDYAILDQMMMSDIESVYINKVGAGELGILNLAGVIKINTKTGMDYHDSVPEETTFKLIAENGYAPTKEYYAPKYKSYTNSLFEAYGAIHWFDDIFLNQEGHGQIRVLNTLQPRIKLFIEGMTVKGDLISEIITIDTGN